MIKVLPQNLVNQIAAGEIIERPSSIIKELLENSIDAGAQNIILKIKNGGISDIEIIDDGIGIPEEEIELAFTRHATSKINSLDDLFSIHSLGFRGEALASISEISKITIITKTTNMDVAYEANILSGKIVSGKYVKANQGVQLKINDIFYNIPARKKFLKSINTETIHIIEEFKKVALANYKINFEFYNNEKKTISLQKTDSIFQRFCQIYELSQDLFFTIESELRSNFNINLIISKPNEKISKPINTIIVNNRVVRDNIIKKAVQTAYTSYIPDPKNISFLINLHIVNGEVDVNVHPQKLEVRWINSSQIFQDITHIVKNKLEKELKEITKNKLIPDQKIIVNNYSYEPGTESFVNENIQNTDFDINNYNNLSSNNLTNFEMKSQELFSFDQVVENNNPQKTNRSYKTTQLFNTYLLIEKEDGVCIIDQHAAAERIAFDYLFDKLINGGLEIVDLLIPIELKLNSTEKLKLLEISPLINKLGFNVGRFGKDDFVINSLPNIFDKANVQKLIIELIREFYNEDFETFEISESNDRLRLLIATIACHNSIRGGYIMHSSEMDWLINELYNTKNPYSCPHGRPIIWEIKKSDFEKKFGRIA